jgi:hypothetical protein
MAYRRRPGIDPVAIPLRDRPDGPDTWEGGEYERIEKRNGAALKAHFDKLAPPAAVAPDFCAVCGREDDLADRKLPGNRWQTICHDCLALATAPSFDRLAA